MAETKKELNYLALGDSYTIGTAIKSQEAFPHQLAESIEAEVGNKVNVRIVAQNGWRTDDLRRAIKRTDLDESYDLVSLLIGVNNQYQQLPVEDFKKDFIQLIDTAIVYAGLDKSNVFVISIPNYGVTPFGMPNKDATTKDLALFNSVIDSICLEREISFFNVTDISLGAENREDYRAKDDLHPSAIQYGNWVASFVNRVIEKI
ncbi:GDSL-type esterase/lipase family protein [Bacteroidia bacterium]|nr:GDSL-type esterase/lipase family protein [Bacteroidia bacterium]